MPDVYCPRHRKNEHMTVGQMMDLIHGLNADLTDEQCSPTHSRDHQTGEVAVYEFCPKESAQLYTGCESYGEHLEAMNDRRLAVKATEVVSP